MVAKKDLTQRRKDEEKGKKIMPRQDAENAKGKKKVAMSSEE